MAVFQEEYTLVGANTATAQNASDILFGDRANRDIRDRYGSMNKLIITSISTNEFDILLDGKTSKRIGRLVSKGSVVLDPEEGKFFDTVQIINLSAAAAVADEVQVSASRCKRIAS